MMKRRDWVAMVKEFQAHFEKPFIPTSSKDWEDMINLRASLIHEEIHELWQAMADMQRNPISREELESAKVQTLDAICDSIYVLIGTANALGFNLEEAFKRVHLGNMAKLGPDGQPIYNAAGKVMKPEGFKHPVLSDLVA